MPKMVKWVVDFETGPTAADCRSTTVMATTKESATKKAEIWVKKASFKHPVFSEPYAAEVSPEVPNLEDDYTDILGWTLEEEEEFLKILDNPESE